MGFFGWFVGGVVWLGCLVALSVGLIYLNTSRRQPFGIPGRPF